MNKQELYDKINEFQLRIDNYREDLIVRLGKAIKNNDRNELDDIYKLSLELKSIQSALNMLKDKAKSL